MQSFTVDVTEAASIMKVHVKTVLDMIASGILPAARIGKSYVLIRKDVEDHVLNEIIKQTAARMRAA